jgi:Na+/H+ antiporter NhaD/arsenite permease-like protein
VALAVAPVLIEICRERGLAPVPFLLSPALACNVGSAVTLVGNPQNILIGQTMGLSFAGYLGRAILPSFFGLAAVGGVSWRYRGEWGETGVRGEPVVDVQAPFRPWPAANCVGVAALVMLAFLFTPWPRELVALACAGIVLTSRRFHSRSMQALVDWQLLVLFIGLFAVNGALAAGFLWTLP